MAAAIPRSTSDEARPAANRLLDPQALAGLSRLQIVARLVVEGFVAGLHKSPRKGLSVEFAEHRAYVPGDEIRRIDWRAFAKSDRLYVKEYEEETNLRATLILDASGSMGYASHGITKFRYASCLTAALAYLMLRQQDSVGLVTFDSALRAYIPPRARPSHLQAITTRIDETQPGAETNLARVLHDLAERTKRRGLIVLISDLFDDPAALLRALAHFRHKRHEVIVFHVLDPAELEFPFKRWHRFRCLESSGRRITVDATRLRKTYRERFDQFLKQIADGCTQRAIDYVQVQTSQPFDQALAQYLSLRMARPR